MVIVNPSSLVCNAKTYSLKRIESHNSNMVMTEILPAHNQNVLGETQFFFICNQGCGKSCSMQTL